MKKFLQDIRIHSSAAKVKRKQLLLIKITFFIFKTSSPSILVNSYQVGWTRQKLILLKIFIK